MQQLSIKMSYLRASAAFCDMAAAIYGINDNEESKKAADIQRKKAAELRKECEQYQYEYVRRGFDGLPQTPKKRKKK